MRWRRQPLQSVFVDVLRYSNGNHVYACRLTSCYFILKIILSNGGPAVCDYDGHVGDARSVSRLTEHLGPHLHQSVRDGRITTRIVAQSVDCVHQGIFIKIPAFNTIEGLRYYSVKRLKLFILCISNWEFRNSFKYVSLNLSITSI